MSQTLEVDNLTFELRRSDRRQTVGITVDREGQLILTAPVDCPLVEIEKVARQKQFWIYTKLAEKELLFQPTRPKEFVSGAGFHYLGRSYRLRLTNGSADHPPLRLHQGRFMLRRDALDQAQQYFIDWYIHHGQPWIERRVSLFSHRIGVEPASVEVRDLGYRWGSCGQENRLYFHWRAMCLPPRIIEYIVAHELVHLHEPHHNSAFWQRLERAMPDYKERKQWLAEHGGRY